MKEIYVVIEHPSGEEITDRVLGLFEDEEMAKEYAQRRALNNMGEVMSIECHLLTPKN